MIKNLAICGLLLLVVSLAGCRCSNCSTRPFNPLAGFGSPRITPPATANYGAANQPGIYYNPNSTATLPTQTFPTNQPNQPNQPSNSVWQPANHSSFNQPGLPANHFVPPAGYPTNHTLAANTTFRTARADQRLDPSRMPLSDATNPAQPARFTPNGNFVQNQPIHIRGQVQYQAQPRVYPAANGVLANSSTAGAYPNGYNGYTYPNQYGQIQTGWQASGQNQINR